MSKLVSIQKIHSIKNHPMADLLLCAKVLGWPVVIRKDEFKENDLVVFFFIDSIVDAENPAFSFLSKQKFRVWNAKFRNQPSSGLVQPLSILGYYGVGPDSVVEGQDVGEITKTIKYERPIPACLGGQVKGNFPLNLIEKTDEDNILSNPGVLDELKGKTIYIAEKADGSSGTFIYNNGEIKVCSRNLELKEDENNSFWRAVKKYDLPSQLTAVNRNIGIQFECVGPGIQGNPMGLKELDLRVFNIKDLDKAEYFGWDEIVSFCYNLKIPHVKLIAVNDNFNSSLDYLRGLADIQKYDNGEPCEGIVIREYSNKIYSSVLNKIISVKIINQNYKQ